MNAVARRNLKQCPTPVQLRAIVEQALLAPSGDNCQPWTFESQGNLLLIHHDAQRAKHPFNFDGIASMLSLGTLLESIRLVSSSHGFDISEQFMALLSMSNSCWVKLEFLPTSQPPRPLSAELSRRSTDRRLYNGGNLNAQMLSYAMSSTDLNSARLHWRAGVSPDLLNFITRAEQLMMVHPLILPKVLEWTRFSKRHVELTRDGLSYANMGIKPYEVPLLLLIRRFPSLLALFRPEMRRQHRARVKAQLESSAGLVCVSARPDSSDAVIEGGKLMMRAWLQLSQNKFGVQPLTIPSMSVYLAAHGKCYEGCDAEWLRLFVEGEEILRREFNIPLGFVPLWMIRTGQSSELPQTLRTRRRPVEDVLKFENLETVK